MKREEDGVGEQERNNSLALWVASGLAAGMILGSSGMAIAMIGGAWTGSLPGDSLGRLSVGLLLGVVGALLVGRAADKAS